MPEVGVESYQDTMDAVGRLAGRVAHHLNNLLTVVEGNAAFLMEAHRDHRFETELREIRHACARAGGLTAQLLAVGGCRWCEPRVVDLARLVSRMDLGRLFQDQVVFCTDLPTDPCLVWIDPDHLEEVVLGLVMNAREAVGARGTVRVAVDRLQGRRGHGRPGPGWVQLEVADSGPGMDQDTLKRVFQPYFSTRVSDDEDRGLGLAVACGVVRQSGGTIRVASAPGQGTTVRVWLPASPPASS